jgi:PKD domain
MRRLRLTVTLMLGALALLAFAAAPAGAFIKEVEVEAGKKVSFGLQQRTAPKIEVAPLQYHGGPVLHSSDSYAIYWDPTGVYRGDWQRLIDKYFQNVGAESGSLGDVFSVDTQYNDSTGHASNQSTFRGGYTDTDPYPITENCTAEYSGVRKNETTEESEKLACLTDKQIRTELQHVISSGALPGATGPAVYYLLTPPHVIVCTTVTNKNCSVSTAAKETQSNGICGYHSVINPTSESPVIYAVQPWVAGDAGLFIEEEKPLTTSGTTPEALACQANSTPLEEPNQLAGLNPFGNYAEGLADVIVNDLSIEQSNIVVDPLFTGWYQNAPVETEHEYPEEGDMCQWAFGPPPETLPTPNPETHAANLSNQTIGNNPYYLQFAFDSVSLTSRNTFECWSGVTLEPHFTAPNPVNVGDVVGFAGTESDITLEAKTKGLPADEPFTATVYKWNFGDGTPVVSGAEDASEFHTYQYGGTYNVTLTVTDAGGNTGTFTEPITVDGTPAPPPPPPPAPAPTPAPPAGASAAGAASGSTSGSTGAGAPKPIPGPVASAAVVSRSLSTVLKKGLVIGYSVNEQVAGQFQVLLAASIAKRIGLHGAPATDMPPGSVPSIVIGKAILVTTKGGRNTVKIQFGKQTAAKLRKLRSVSLTIRLVVRNASSKTPLTTTVISTVTLSR